MKRLSQSGDVNVLLVPLILVTLLFLGAGAFAVWAFNGRQHYKNDTDQIVSAQVAAAKSQQSAADQKQFAEQAKQPYKTYKGPSSLGSIAVMYPKTWNGLVTFNSAASNQVLLDGYFYPDVAPSLYAVRINVLQQSYTDVVNQITSNGTSQNVTAKPYAFPKVPGVVGVKLTGTIENNNTTGTMIVVPLRTTTLEVWTEGSKYLGDFNNIILKNFTFLP
ncbi:MAG TPA: hypothetical protein VHD60_00800 [Candidatus Saccharimonadales bacterium]|nr:hypothetical protein [Candidatus Saccharimonadales bacterium]